MKKHRTAPVRLAEDALRHAVAGTASDVIVMAHIPASHDQVYLVSIPRDTEVKIPG